MVDSVVEEVDHLVAEGVVVDSVRQEVDEVEPEVEPLAVDVEEEPVVAVVVKNYSSQIMKYSFNTGGKRSRLKGRLKSCH